MGYRLHSGLLYSFAFLSLYNKNEIIGDKPMKTNEELEQIKEEIEKLNEKLATLTEEELAQVIGGNVIVGKFPCHVCGKQFDSLIAMEKHVIDAHGNLPFL